MKTAESILSIAKNEIGTKDTPVNNVKYNTEYYGKAVSGDWYPWCCAFVWWVFKHADASSILYDGCRIAACTPLMNWFKSKKRFVTSSYRRGDLVFFNWTSNKSSVAEHIGILESVNADGSLVTIEGNTSVSNNSAGGQVMRRTRKLSCVLGCARPAYISADNNTVSVRLKTSYLRSNAWVDDYAKSSVKLKTLKIGTKLTWIFDDGWGWSKVKLGTVSGYIQNSRIDKKGLSPYKKVKLKMNADLYSKPCDKAPKLQAKKGTTLYLNCIIESGKFKNWCWVSYGGKDYAVKLSYISVNG